MKHNGNRMDIGGHRFFSKDERIMDWWKTVLPLQGAPSYDDKLGRDHEHGAGRPRSGDGGQGDAQAPPSVPYLLEPPLLRLPDFMSPNTLKAMGFKLTMVAGFSYLKSMFHTSCRKTIWRTSTSTVSAASCIRCSSRATRKLWGHPSQISADWGAQRVKGLSIMGVLKNAFQKLLPKKRSNAEVETSLIEEFWYPKYGPGQLGDRRVHPVQAAGVKVLTDAGWSRSARPMVPCLPWCTRIPRATAPSFPATSSSPRCRSRTGQRAIDGRRRS